MLEHFSLDLYHSLLVFSPIFTIFNILQASGTFRELGKWVKERAKKADSVIK